MSAGIAKDCWTTKASPVDKNYIKCIHPTQIKWISKIVCLHKRINHWSGEKLIMTSMYSSLACSILPSFRCMTGALIYHALGPRFNPSTTFFFFPICLFLHFCCCCCCCFVIYLWLFDSRMTGSRPTLIPDMWYFDTISWCHYQLGNIVKDNLLFRIKNLFTFLSRAFFCVLTGVITTGLSVLTRT